MNYNLTSTYVQNHPELSGYSVSVKPIIGAELVKHALGGLPVLVSLNPRGDYRTKVRL